MANTDDADSIESYLGALRADVAVPPAAARERLVGRLAQAGLVAAAPLALVRLGSALPRPPAWLSPWVTTAVTLPVGILMGALGHAWVTAPTAASSRQAVPKPVAALVAPSKAAVVAAPRPAVDLPISELPALEEPAPARSVGGAPAARPAARLPSAAGLQPQPALPRAVSVATPPPSGAAALRTDLERELSLLERARTRLSEGYAAAALDLLNAHRSSYPRSALTQEREALTVKALSAAGRADEAREAGEAFSRRFPKSVLRPSVDRATEGSP